MTGMSSGLKLIPTAVSQTGMVVLLISKALRFIARGRSNVVHTLQQTASIGFDSLPVTVLICLISGSVLGLQTAQRFAQTGADNYVGGLVSLALVREIAPIFAALAVSSRAGTAIAAEIANMVVTKQVDALRVMHVSPVRYLVVPRLLACIISLPLLTIIGEVVGIAGALLMARNVAHMHPSLFLESVWLSLKPSDVGISMIKALVFGMFLAAICCHIGLSTRGGASQVGQSTTRATVWVSVMVVVVDFFLSWLFYGGSSSPF